ncbi:MAG TPA: ATP-binding protein [Ktedonobacteraceae bacterium]|nr:ATP-binding protein [Ktedonobacteraceae bacterium]
MERLNEIINRTAQRRQSSGLDKSSPYNTPPQSSRPGTNPGRRPLPEQNARLGQYGNASWTQQHRAATPPRSQQSSPLPRTSGQTGGNQTHYTSSHRSVGERYTPAPERSSWPQANHTPARHAESYRPVPQADTQADWSHEWEEDIAPIRHGDWESDGYDEAAPARDASDSYLLNRASARIAQTYPRNQRSMVTRELRSQLDDEIEPTVTPHTREARMPIPLPPPATQRAVQTPRLTQPLNRSTSMVRLHQDASNTPQPVIPAPYTTSVATCPVCKGAGYLRADVPYGHPNFGKPIACTCKENERTAKRRRQLQEVSNLGELQDKSFENFNPNTSRSVYNAYRTALEYAEDPYGWLVLIGKVGCGKTHLAAAIANRLLASGSLVLFSTVSDLLDHLRATFMPTSTEVYDQLFQKMREAALLVLDDLGAQQSSPWANEKLFQLLNYRYNSRIPTIITTNNTGLQGVEERIRSRMTDTGLVTRITFEDAVDYRLRNPRRD